jgi:hypothetical protein
MAWTNEGDSFYRITSVTALGNTINGMVSAVVEKIVERESRMSAANNSSVSSPIAFLGARVLLTFMDIASPVAHGTSAANIVVNFSKAGGSTGSVTIGSMLAGSVTHNMSRGDGAVVTQEFSHEGSSLTYTLSA